MMNFFGFFSLSILLVISAVQFDQDDLRYQSNATMKVKGSTNTYAEAINYGQTHPTRDGGSWSGW
jgi:hypothetical protein